MLQVAKNKHKTRIGTFYWEYFKNKLWIVIIKLWICNCAFVHFFIPQFPAVEQLWESWYDSLSLIQLFLLVCFSWYLCVLGLGFNIMPRWIEGKLHGLKMHCRFLCYACFCLVLFYESTTLPLECNIVPYGNCHSILQQPCAAQCGVGYCRLLNWAAVYALYTRSGSPAPAEESWSQAALSRPGCIIPGAGVMAGLECVSSFRTDKTSPSFMPQCLANSILSKWDMYSTLVNLLGYCALFF